VPKIKLPTIQILKFGGQIAEFKHFYDTFNSLIINNQALDDVQKFHYLLSSVTSEAHQLIQNLPVTQQNFHVAGTLLCDRYNNERLIAAAHVKSLLSLPVINKGSATDLRTLINQPPCSHGTYQHEAITSRIRQLLMICTWLPETC